MKKIINGRMYDTETATYLGHDGGGESFRRWSEELYKKRTGEYFIYGAGGPDTKYAIPIGNNNWGSGENIIPITAGAAREWAEMHLTADEYATIFGIPNEDECNDLTPMTVRINSALLAKVKDKASNAGVSLRECVESMLRNGLK